MIWFKGSESGVHVCIYVCLCPHIFVHMSVCVYTCIRVCVYERERESERAECVWLGAADGFYQEDLSAGRNRGTCV